jgi:Immunity protein 52
MRFLWGQRREAVGKCVRRLAAFLVVLKKIDPVFGKWERIGRSTPTEYRVPISPRQLKKWLCEKAVSPIDEKGYAECGFGLSLQIIIAGDSFVLRLNCGSGFEWANNNCVMHFPRDPKIAARILKSPVLKQIAKAVVECWQPDHGVISIDECREVLSPTDAYHEVGWITYLSDRYKPIEAVPAGARVESLAKGVLIATTGPRYSHKNKKLMKTLAQLSASVSLR